VELATAIFMLQEVIESCSWNMKEEKTLRNVSGLVTIYMASYARGPESQPCSSNTQLLLQTKWNLEQSGTVPPQYKNDCRSHSGLQTGGMII